MTHYNLDGFLLSRSASDLGTAGDYQSSDNLSILLIKMGLLLHALFYIPQNEYNIYWNQDKKSKKNISPKPSPDILSDNYQLASFCHKKVQADFFQKKIDML